MMLTCLAAVLLFSPHLYWLLGEGYLFEIRESLGEKLGKEDSGILILGPILKMGKALFEGMLPILILTAILFFFKKKQWTVDPKLKWLFHLGVSQILVLVMLFVIVDAQDVHGRWLLPLLLPYLVVFVSLFREVKSNYIKWGTILYFSVLTFQLVRTPFEKLLGIPSDIHFEFSELHQKLNKEFPTETWVLPNVTYGGQVRLLNPTREIFTLDDFSATIPKNFENRYGVVSNEKGATGLAPIDSIPQYGPDKDNLYFFDTNIPFNNFFQKK
ncbi:MAG: hypothetical protein AB3N18_08230, partial [Allomuricauda sp.]